MTKPIKLDADFGGVITDFDGNKEQVLNFPKINRKDFGLNWSATTEAGGLVVADDVKLSVSLEFIKQ